MRFIGAIITIAGLLLIHYDHAVIINGTALMMIGVILYLLGYLGYLLRKE